MSAREESTTGKKISPFVANSKDVFIFSNWSASRFSYSQFINPVSFTIDEA